MKRLLKAVVITALVAAVVSTILFLSKDINIDVLNPQGEIAAKQRDLLVFTTLLSLVVIIPVFVMLITFSLRYNATNKKKAVYKPNWDGNNALEAIWWGIPCVIILILSVITWQTTHELDPYKKLVSNVKPLNVQVVSLQWKWLFIYPDQGVASVNLLQIPKDTPVNFTITSDAPMNSFWIPSLGGQVYAMSGMSTQLSLIADKTGEFKGSSANLSGSGFADMNFTVRSGSQSEFDAWVATLRNSNNPLDKTSYDELARPAIVETPLSYTLTQPGLYDTIVMKYMSHGSNHVHVEGAE